MDNAMLAKKIRDLFILMLFLLLTVLVMPRLPNSAKLVMAQLRVKKNLGRDAVIRVYDAVGNGIETHQRKGHFKEGEVSSSGSIAERQPHTRLRPCKRCAV